MKKTLTGWIGRSRKLEEVLYKKTWGYPHIELDDVFTTKGVKSDWDEEDWPSIKVKVTVETVEK